jgi:hypothetical protein
MRFDTLMVVIMKITLFRDVMHLPDYAPSHPEGGYLQNFTTSTYKYLLKEF